MYSDIFCRVYNEFGWNYYPEAFAEQLLQMLRERELNIRSCLDLGCGTGILCHHLRQNGIAPRGLDLSPGMIAIAREEFPGIPFDVGDMTAFSYDTPFDLVTCTGDAINHLPQLELVENCFRRVYENLAPGGYFVFDLLDEKEVSDSEPFEMDFSETVRVWFQMTRPRENQVCLTVRVYEAGVLTLEEQIRETLHDPQVILRMLADVGFEILKCGHRLPESGDGNAATWFLIARKEC